MFFLPIIIIPMQFTLGDLTRRRAALPMSRQMKPVLRAFSQLTIASHPSTRPVLVSSRRSRLATCTPSLARTSVHSKSITSNQQRNAGSASNSQWKARQRNDHYVQKAKVQGLKSRAAYKLLEVRPDPDPSSSSVSFPPSPLSPLPPLPPRRFPPPQEQKEQQPEPQP